MSKEEPLAPGEETVPPDEPALIDALVAIQHHIQEKRFQRRRPVRRGQHPKQHACVRAEWVVEPRLPPELAQGVCSEPRSYPALVRFSNARQQNDELPDVHGVAVKLLDVAGSRLLPEEPEARTQDFVFIDHPVFFARDVADLVPLMIDFRRLMIGRGIERAFTLLKGALSLDYRFRILRQMLRKLPHDLASIPYWTTTPVRWGDGAVKLSLRPQVTRTEQMREEGLKRDKLRLALARRLQQQAIGFDVCVQVQGDPLATPIENAAVPWDERRSPYRKVATLRIPPQRFDALGQFTFGENLSFSPWHGITAHRPLGGINRARRRVYEVMAQQRRLMNAAPRREPTPADLQALWPV